MNMAPLLPMRKLPGASGDIQPPVLQQLRRQTTPTKRFFLQGGLTLLLLLGMTLSLLTTVTSAQPAGSRLSDQHCPLPAPNPNVIKVGYLTAARAVKASNIGKYMQGRIISGAMTLAVRAVNRAKVIPNHTLEFSWADTHADTLHGTAALTRLWRQGAVAFFGTEDSCAVEARVASSWNLPMISYVSITFFSYRQ